MPEPVWGTALTALHQEITIWPRGMISTPNLLDNPDFRNLSAGDASSVKLGEGSNETVEVKLISGEKVAAAVAALPW